MKRNSEATDFIRVGHVSITENELFCHFAGLSLECGFGFVSVVTYIKNIVCTNCFIKILEVVGKDAKDMFNGFLFFFLFILSITLLGRIYIYER